MPGYIYNGFCLPGNQGFLQAFVAVVGEQVMAGTCVEYMAKVERAHGFSVEAVVTSVGEQIAIISGSIQAYQLT